jgi:hypothetical protein
MDLKTMFGDDYKRPRRQNRGQLPWEEMLPLTYPKRDSTIEAFKLFTANFWEIHVNTVAQRSHGEDARRLPAALLAPGVRIVISPARGSDS